MLINPKLTAADLLMAACQYGLTPFGTAPKIGWDCKILIGSIVDVSAPGVRARLVELHRSGTITLSRIDSVGSIPQDRRHVYASGIIESRYELFDTVVFVGGQLLGSKVR